jgi:hypothetical protein
MEQRHVLLSSSSLQQRLPFPELYAMPGLVEIPSSQSGGESRQAILCVLDRALGIIDDSFFGGNSVDTTVPQEVDEIQKPRQ